MKTNLVDLMSKISQLETEQSELSYDLRNCMNVKVIELNGHETMLEEYPHFMDDFNKYMEIGEEISKLKGVLYEKNNSLKLTTGLTIQQALFDIQNKKKMLSLVKSLTRQNPSKRRTTENTNSYFTAQELAYDKEYMKRTEEDLKEIIQKLELEISQLNSQMFEIDM
ncbi:MAG: hypothetical protein ACLTPN_01115 [Clostridia bacterium]|jgi:hypothetical protein